MVKYSHLLITIFNLETTRGKADLAWLNNRFQLFDNYCYPSVYSQTNQNFKWLVFFSDETPEVFREKIEEYSKWETFIPIYTDCAFFNKYPKKLKKYIINNINEGTEYLITTRLDNDDAIHKEFIQRVQDNFIEENFLFLNFFQGYQLIKNKLYKFKQNPSHFISLIERYDPNSFKTVYCGSHSQLEKVGKIKNIKTKRLYLENIHGNNFINNYGGGVRVSLKNLDNFLIKRDRIPKHDNLLSFWLDKIFYYSSIPKKLIEKRKSFLRK